MKNSVSHSPVIIMEASFPAIMDAPCPDAPSPASANDNRRVKSDWMTPAEAMQVVQRIKQKILAENQRSQTLMQSPQRRRIWEEVLACEQCLQWKYFRK